MTIIRKQGAGGRNLDAALKILDKKVAKIGWFKGNYYPDEQTKKGKIIKGLPVAYVAAIQIKGAPSKGIPPRDFMYPTLREKKSEWDRLSLQGSKAVLRGQYTATDLMELLGKAVAGSLRAAIARLTSPPLKPATIAARLRRRNVKKASSIANKHSRGIALSGGEQASLGNLSKPLIDTNLMYSTLINVVEDA